MQSGNCVKQRIFPTLLAAVVLGHGYGNECTGQDVAVAPNTQSPLASFEVAVINPTPSSYVNGSQWSKPGGNTFRAKGVSLESLTAMAYGIDSTQIKGGPNWFASKEFDLNAKAQQGVLLTREGIQLCLQRLLQERFDLKVHHETESRQGFALVLAKNGSKLVATQGAEFPNFRVNVGPGKLQGKNWSMEFCALMLAPKVGRPVVDRTGLQGRYDIDIEYNPDMLADVGDQPGLPLPSLATAIQERLGLRLVAERVSVDLIIIDQVRSLPTEN
jgi:uncharacterized protein (TIGR03435 family)